MSDQTSRPIAGFNLASGVAGLKKNGRADLVLIQLAEGSTVAAMFTRNAFAAAPIIIARQHLAGGSVRALLVNAGNANAGTGAQGLAAATECCESVARLLSVPAQSVLPFSTGVIGEPLHVSKVVSLLPQLANELSEDGWESASRAIMTTDTVPKLRSCTGKYADRKFTITGMTKGAGMIRPDMATMLAFIATDATLPEALLQTALDRAVNRSFNRITIDGDTSTNDAVVLVATGAGESLSISSESDPAYEAFCECLDELCTDLAQAIVRDGEGASKFISIEVMGGLTEAECLDVAYTVAHSPLVKTAFFASDANWGRILAAVGRSGLDALNVDRIDIWLDDVQIVASGGRAADYTEQSGAAVMAQPDINVRIELGRGDSSATVWTCDLSHDYVSINADYRT